MFFATKVKRGLGLVAALFLSAISMQQAQAGAPIDYFTSLPTRHRALLVAGIAVTPYLINFFARKPLTNNRFEPNRLFHGTLKEKIMHLHYFISDIVFGWPYKDGDIIFEKNDDGESDLTVQAEQLSAGLLGNSIDYFEEIIEALTLPVTMAISTATIVKGLTWVAGSNGTVHKP